MIDEKVKLNNELISNQNKINELNNEINKLKLHTTETKVFTAIIFTIETLFATIILNNILLLKLIPATNIIINQLIPIIASSLIGTVLSKKYLKNKEKKYNKINTIIPNNQELLLKIITEKEIQKETLNNYNCIIKNTLNSTTDTIEEEYEDKNELITTINTNTSKLEESKRLIGIYSKEKTIQNLFSNITEKGDVATQTLIYTISSLIITFIVANISCLTLLSKGSFLTLPNLFTIPIASAIITLPICKKILSTKKKVYDYYQEKININKKYIKETSNLDKEINKSISIQRKIISLKEKLSKLTNTKKTSIPTIKPIHQEEIKKEKRNTKILKP